jgi:hypothetical protein
VTCSIRVRLPIELSRFPLTLLESKMTVTIKKVSVGSAFKVGLVLSAIAFAIFGLIGLGLQALFANALSAAFRNAGNGSNFDFGATSLTFFCVGYLIGIVASGIFGGIGAAIYAVLYNLTSGITGGLQVELSRDNP